MARSLLSLGGRLAGVPLAVVIAVLAGVLVAGIALPPVAAVGLATKAGADEFDALPTDLANDPLPQRSRLLDRDGNFLAELFLDYDRVNVSLAQVSQQTRNAFIAIEDSRFYEHNGVDVQGLARAAVANQQAGEVTQGGSTLTQQYVKQRLLQTADTEEEQAEATAQNVTRKLREARLALELERQTDKDDILQGYLNIVSFGGSVYGIGTAAEAYFGKAAGDLTLPEAALLAGMVQRPTAFNPRANPVDSRERRDVVLDRMAELGFVTAAQLEQAKATEVTVVPEKEQLGCAAADRAAYFCDLVLQQLQNTDLLGPDRESRIRTLFQGGLSIYTTMDADMQRAADEALLARVPLDDEFGGAVAMVEPGTGHVKAIANNRVYGKDPTAGEVLADGTEVPAPEGEAEVPEGPRLTEVNYATGRGGAGVEAGSSFKTFTLVQAMQEGVPYDLSFYAPNKYHAVQADNPGKGFFQNATGEVGESGTYDLRRAIELSVNTFFVPLQERVGVLDTARTAEKMGVEFKNAEVGDPNSGLADGSNAFTLGIARTTPLSMANAYATIANSGRACDIRVVERIENSRGETLDIPGPRCDQVVEPAVADGVADMLTGVLTSRGTAGRAALDRPAAGKTGTGQDYKSAFFAGFTPQLSTAVWVGHPKEPEMNAMRNVRIGGQFYSKVFGGTIPAPIWSEAMRDALADAEELPIPDLDRDALAGQKVTVPSVTGVPASAAGRALVDAGLGYQVGGGEGITEDASTVRSQSPRAGSSVDRGTSVILSTRANPRGSSGGGTTARGSGSRGGSSGSGSGARSTPRPAPRATAPAPRPTATAPAPAPTAGGGGGSGSGAGGGSGSGAGGGSGSGSGGGSGSGSGAGGGESGGGSAGGAAPGSVATARPQGE